jgi:hypothetical protein
MLDIFARIERARAAMASRLAALGAGFVAQLGAGFVLALASVPLIATGRSWFALPVLLSGLVLMASGSAGARASQLSAALLLVVFAALPFAFALDDPARALAATFLLFAMIAAGAASLFANADRRLPIVDIALCTSAFVLACLFPSWFSLIAYALGLLCFIAAGARFAHAIAQGRA